VEGKKKYENWEYDIIPGLTDEEQLSKLNEGERENSLIAKIKNCLYSIHIIDSEDDLNKETDKAQYYLVQSSSNETCCYKQIIWLPNPELKDKISKEINTNPVITGSDYECLFNLIKSLDEEKNSKIEKMRKMFSLDKKVFMFYDFSKDHENGLRINLKSKLEENPNVVVKFSVPNASYEKDKQDLDSCDGGFIFYGQTDPQWFAMRQSILIDAGFAHSKAICIDEPDIEKKANRDVSKNAFITIKGQQNLESGVKDFVEKLNTSEYDT
jgi:hypothetical protein